MASYKLFLNDEFGVTAYVIYAYVCKEIIDTPQMYMKP